MKVQLCHSFDNLPENFDNLFEYAGKNNFFLLKLWFQLFEKHIAVKDKLPLFIFYIEDSGQPVFLLPFYYDKKNKILHSLSNYYSSSYAPVYKDELSLESLLTLLVAFIKDVLPEVAQISIKPLASNDDSYRQFLKVLAENDYVCESYYMFGNWSVNTSKLSYRDYFNKLPGILRSTIKRKQKKIISDDNFQLKIFSAYKDIQKHMAGFQSVYNQSWKIAEPYPEFIEDLVLSMSQHYQCTRLGMIFYKKKPVAAQTWFVWSQKALIFKLAYVEDDLFKKLSVGTVLTAKLIEYVIENDHVDSIDYLTGDDDYKKNWMSDRKEFWGIHAYNKKTNLGILKIFKYKLSSLVKHFKNMR